MDAETRSCLEMMGFSPAVIAKVESMGAKNVESAIDLIPTIMETNVPMETASAAEPPKETAVEESTVELIESESTPTSDAAVVAPPEAKSFKCDDCGKLLKSEAEVEFHAVKSSHVNFSESTDEVKPLSEDEKRVRVANLQATIKKRREEEAEKDKKVALEMEKKRRQTGQEIAMAKQRLQEQEMRQIAEERKKQKAADRARKAEILDQIKHDREAKHHQPQEAVAAVVKTPSSPTKSSPVKAAVDHTHCKIQIRLTDGATLTQTFGAKEHLAAVRCYVMTNRTDVEGTQPFKLMSNFPKKVFTEEDMTAPLDTLGLCPTAVLFVTK